MRRGRMMKRIGNGNIGGKNAVMVMNALEVIMAWSSFAFKVTWRRQEPIQRAAVPVKQISYALLTSCFDDAVLRIRRPSSVVNPV